jgi:hypothetical protein
MKDKYSLACDYFDAIEDEEEFKHAVRKAWYSPRTEGPRCLFQFVTPHGEARWDENTNAEGKSTGCIVMLRLTQSYHAWTPELTEAIRKDKRIPINVSEVTKSMLRKVFAPWQRKIDKILGRK